MHRIEEIIKNRKFVKEAIQRSEEQKAVVFITYFCLVCAILLFFREAGDFSYNHLLVFGSIILLSCLLWPFKKKSRWKEALFVLFAYFFCFCLLKRSLDEQLNLLFYCLMNQKTGSGDFTLLFLALSFLVSLFCLFFVPVLNKGWIFYGFTLFLLFLGPLFGYQPSGLVLGLLAAFHIGNSVYSALYPKRSDETGENNTRAAVLQKGFVAGLLLVFGAFFFAKLISAENRKGWMKESMEFTQSLTHGVKAPDYLTSYRESGENRTAVSISGSVGVQSGKISRGNHYSSSVLQLELTLSQMPEERMYLKDFTGGDYQGDAWAEADETDFDAVFNYGQEELASSHISPAYFEQRQFEMIRYGKREMAQKEGKNPGGQSTEEPESQKLEIHPVNGARNSFFSPYLSSYVSRDSEGVCLFELFSWNEYRQYQEKLGEKPMQWFAKMEEPYQAYAAQKYLSVPEERLPRLLALCREHPLEDPRKITLWIRQTLTDCADYSRTPGFMPYGTDIAEYFLFDGQEGYCQHFATAAVLMYRMQGIPARYVTGYAADPADFSLGTDGKYHARLTDEKAHAWAEIYLGGPGWLPVEVTPPDERSGNSRGEDGSARGEEDVEAEEGVKNQEDWMLSFMQEESEEDKPEEEERKEDAKEENSGEQISEQDPGPVDADEPQVMDKDAEKLRNGQSGEVIEAAEVIGMAGIAVILGLAFVGTRRAVRRQRKKRLQQLGADELYQKMVVLLHLGGYGEEFDGTEPTFCPAVVAQLEKEEEMEENLGLPVGFEDSRLSLEELEEIRAYAFQTAYGREISSDKEREKAEEGYERMAAEIAGRLYGIKKIKWRIMEMMLVWEKRDSRRE